MKNTTFQSKYYLCVISNVCFDLTDMLQICNAVWKSCCQASIEPSRLKSIFRYSFLNPSFFSPCSVPVDNERGPLTEKERPLTEKERSVTEKEGPSTEKENSKLMQASTN